MPAIIIGLVRAVIQFSITIGMAEVAQRVLNIVIEKVMQLFGASEEQAKDIVANQYLQLAEEIGLSAIALKTRVPSVVADRLGFTTKGFVFRNTVIGQRTTTVAKATTAAAVKAEQGAIIAETAQVIAAKKGSTFQIVSNAASIIIAGLGVPVGVGLLITNTIDFGAWSSSAYQGTFQKLLSIFGLEPDVNYVKSIVLSEDMSKKIFAVYTNAGATGIRDPRTDGLMAFTRENFINVADFVATQIILEKGEVKTKEMLAAMTALVVLGNSPEVRNTTTTIKSPTATSTSSNVKVFTGIISQGVLGSAPAFVERPNDIIESISELQDAAQNNLASFLISLPAKIVYEVKLVNSVITRDGLQLTGQTQQVVSGYYASGQPKYRTLTNKFAVLNLYVITDRNTRAKIATINLGPTDAAKLNPSAGTLATLGGTIQASAVTTDIADIRTIQTQAPVTIAPPPAPIQQLPAPTAPTQTAKQTFVYSDTPVILWNETMIADRKAKGWKISDKPNSDGTFNGYEPIDPITKSAVSVDVVRAAERNIATTLKGANATNLSEWYQANGKALPTVSERAPVYERAGLGQASLYIGTAEQNTKLLNALKAGAV